MRSGSKPGASRVRLSADIGGTFTDLVLEFEGRLATRKVLTTPDRPERALIEGAGSLLADSGLGFADVDTIAHGTTLATNALLERRGARVALLTTHGFRDVLETGHENRYNQYDLTAARPPVLVERTLRFTATERMFADGGIAIALDEEEVARLVPTLKRAGVDSVAISFLHSYANPAHEQAAARLLRDMMPGVKLSISSDVCPEIREYERTSTTVVDAYVKPLISEYLSRLNAELHGRGFSGTVSIITSGGGLCSLETARDFPVRLVESGPAGGALFAAMVAERSATPRAIALDMGGTTAKLCLIDDYRLEMSRTFEVDRAATFLKGSGIPIVLPVVELIEIGAGGGSIAGVDALGRVTVGPQSASSVPGPAAYGNGGTRATSTDADIILGLIDPTGFGGGAITLDPERARAALRADVGDRLAVDEVRSAHAVYEVLCETTAKAARAHVAERGADIRRHAMIVSGGAAPLHAARIAEKLGISRIIVPAHADVGSAMGFLDGPVSFERVRTLRMTVESADVEVVNLLLEELSDETRRNVSALADEGEIAERRVAHMRYTGQGHELAVEIPAATVNGATIAELATRFRNRYAQHYGRTVPGGLVEITSWSVIASGPRTRSAFPTRQVVPHVPEPDAYSQVFDPAGEGFARVPAYRRERLVAGARIQGPALITEPGTSTFVTASYSADIDENGSIVMGLKEARKS